MNPLTPAWTKLHTCFVIVLVPTVLGVAVAAWGENFWWAITIAAIFALTAVIGLAFEPFLALIVGFAGAALMILLKQIAGRWEPGAFIASGWEILLLIATGLLAGGVGRRVEALVTSEARATESVEAPAFGSLGLLRPEFGEIRLEDEIDRARLYQRPLTVLKVAIDLIPDQPLLEAEREGISRAVARLNESMLRVTDILFAYGEDCIVAILPETDLEGAWLHVSRVVDAVKNATFVVRPTGTRHAVKDYAYVHFAVVVFPDHGDSAAELLAASAETIEYYRRQQDVASRERATPEIPMDGQLPLSSVEGPLGTLDLTAPTRGHESVDRPITQEHVDE